MVRLHQRLTEIGVKPDVAFDVKQAEDAVGADVVAKANAASKALLGRCTDIEKPFARAYEVLRAALVEEFDDKSIVSLDFKKMAELEAKDA